MRERSLPYRIIHGDRHFAVHATGTQGIPWRCSTAEFPARAADTIDGLDTAAIRDEFSVADMRALAVYKVRPSEADDAAFDRVLNRLRALAGYYRWAVDNAFDLIIHID